ncbi:MAG: arginine repressor [Actinomycetaceae bacterium]|nr:arginine repressor [Actinomycetaceae bacterium]MDU0970174.1 arginine repressor [Actinomycetaceae bacterium]
MSSVAIPLTKSARQARVADLIMNEEISSQVLLRERLATEGIDVTQATLSRDLMELKATKVRTRAGRPLYSLPSDGGLRRAEEATVSQLERWCQELLVACDRVGNQVVLRTPAGAAQLLASAIDRAVLEGVVGTIGGDDTILLICRTPHDATQAITHLLGFIDHMPSSKTNEESDDNE